jgi:O-antigen/teichoic acid export membrane protein
MTGEYGLNKLIFFWVNKRKFGTDCQFNSEYAKLLISRSWKIILAGIVIAFQVRVEYYLIENFLDWNSVGQYAAALKIFEILDVAPIILAMVLMPKLVSSLQGKSKKRFTEAFQLIYFGGLGLYLILLPIMGIVIWLFPYAFGEKYLAAQTLLPLLIIRRLFGMLNAIRGVFVIIERYYFYPLIASSMGFIISLVTSLMLIPKFGLIGAVIANLAGLFGSTILSDLLFYGKSTVALANSFQQLPFAIEKLRSFSFKD